jgi:fatty acid desaturase
MSWVRFPHPARNGLGPEGPELRSSDEDREPGTTIVRRRVGTIAIATVTLAVLVLVGLEAAGVDLPAWWLVVAFVAVAGIYLFEGNRVPS